MGSEFSRGVGGEFSDSSQDEYERQERRRNCPFGIGSDLEDSSDASDASDSSTSNRQKKQPAVEQPKKRQKLELKYEVEEGAGGEDDDEDEDQIEQLSNYEDNGSFLKIRSLFWTIRGFSHSDVYKKNRCVRSPVFVTGDYNRFQFYFEMVSFKTDTETQFGVYVNVLSNIRSEATVSYQSFIVELRGHRYLLAKKGSKLPKKPGFRFLGYLTSDRLEDDYWSYRYVPEDDLTLAFKINVNYKTRHSFDDLENLMGNNKERDVTLVVGDKHFTANRKILSEKSTHFASLLNQSSKTNKIKIKDVSPGVMRQLLMFIYTGKVSKLFTHITELTAAANKYKLNDLKAMCKKVK